MFRDDARTVTADILVAFVHAFTLPTFFILAGFFSAMLFFQRGPLEFARNRAARIALPFAIGWLLLHPLVAGGFVFANVAQATSIERGLDVVGGAMMSGALFFLGTPMHLWFMYDLIFFYLVVLALAPLIARVPPAWREQFQAASSAIFARPWLRLPLLGLVTFLMLRMVGGTLVAASSFVPDWIMLLGYGMYFGVGWLLYLSRQVILGFERYAWTTFLAGLTLFFIILPAVAQLTGMRGSDTIWWTMVSATVVWLLFFGLAGLFLRHFNHPSPFIRYVVDASFWIYLVHLPLAVWLQGLFSGLDLWPWIKIFMVVSAIYFVGFVSYDLFVRSSVVGQVLNGRRYPRAIFRRGLIEAPQT
jgi:glucan biosynthesis protein C